MLLIVNNHDSFTYNLVDLLRRIRGLEMVVCDTEQLNLQQLDLFSHILISPVLIYLKPTRNYLSC